MVKVNSDLNNSKLTAEASAWLKEICKIEKIDPNLAAVSKELQNIFHRLSLKAHYLKNYDTGLYIGGEEFPTRAAVAILILKAQMQKAFKAGPIYYCDEKYNVLARLKDGNVIPITK